MGRIRVHLHGRPKQKSFSQLIENYGDRLRSRNIKLEIHSDKENPNDYQNQLLKNKLIYLLDEKGSDFSSVECSDKVTEWSLNSEDVHLAIGPVDGWPQKEKITSKNSITLSKMTFPHELAAVILLEQIYRSTEIIKGTLYHRA